MIRATRARSPDCPSKAIRHLCYRPFDALGCQSETNEHIGPACTADNGKVAATCMCHLFSFLPTSGVLSWTIRKRIKVQATKLPCPRTSLSRSLVKIRFSNLSIVMAVANRENHLVSDAFERTMNVFSDHLIVVAEESNAMLQNRNNQRLMYLVLLPRVKTLDNLPSHLCNKTVFMSKAMKTTTDAYHLGNNTRRVRGVHRPQLQKRQPLTLARR